MLTIFLIKPLFSFTRSKESDNSVEVFREDCPRLFAVIDDIVRHTGNKMPKHVYLSADVNACVFFNSSFWSIFFPIRKNLKIGLGLFDGLSVDEVKSVLAHEFGHFSQKSMKVGSTVYIANQVLYNMTYTEDFWDKLLDSWCSSSYTPWALTGGLTRMFTNWIKQMNVSMYRFVERGYRKLSRQMEFDADNVSCSYVGTDVFVSGLCKTEVNSSHNDLFIDTLKSLISEKKIVNNIFDAYQIMLTEIPIGYKVEMSHKILMTEPHEQLRAKSRVSIQGTWDSHPENSARLENARKYAASMRSNEAVEAWSLIPDALKEKVSDMFLSQIDEMDKLQKLSDEEYKDWIDSYFANNLYKPEFRPFFARRIIPFDLETTGNVKVANPFTERNREIIEQFLVANRDWTTLNQVNSREIEVDHIEYDEKEVSLKSLPSIIASHKQYYEDLFNKVIQIDRRVYVYMLQEAKDDAIRKKISNAYHLLFYADFTINKNLANLFNACNEIKTNLNDVIQSVYRTEDDIECLRQGVMRYMDHLKDSIKELDMETIKSVTDDEYVQQLKSVLKMTVPEDLNGDFLNTVIFSIPQDLLRINQMLENLAKSNISEMAEMYLKPSEMEDEEDFDQNGEHISVADYEIEEQIDDHTWIFFFVYAAFIIVLFGLKNCSQTTQDNVNTRQVEEVSPFHIRDGEITYDAPQEKPQIFENEISDGNVSVVLPKGVYAEKEDFGDGSYAFDLCDNTESPSYSIRLFSSVATDFDDTKFEEIWSQAKQQNEEGSVSAEYGKMMKESLTNYETYSRTTVYHGEQETEWKFIIVCDNMSDKVVLLSCWSQKGVNIPLKEIIENIRF
jgi:Zn-dependent protease with chaperone function